MEMVERVARALAACEQTQESDVLYYPYEKRSDDYLALARAAIEAMREPTEEMAYAGGWPTACPDRALLGSFGPP